ncbi:hypothetical protein [Tahibacter amnicola]|uniref:WD40 repeat protein n=1 Tax=Tahibacter amnicola TaxID=2976241 RepID=A0ABY6BIE0_9GAMM|nr:hypothetical protein [Tahibacter amnicola]UXI69783.1 hypothetical protein N4264_09180 [Tahibacter amnicola]
MPLLHFHASIATPGENRSRHCGRSGRHRRKCAVGPLAIQSERSSAGIILRPKGAMPEPLARCAMRRWRICAAPSCLENATTVRKDAAHSPSQHTAMHSPNTPRRVFLLSLLLATAFPLQAAGPTGEEESYSVVAAGTWPLVLSGNGEWRVHSDGSRVLHRTNLATPDQDQRIQLPGAPRLLSASRSAQKVAIAFNEYCVAIADFGPPSAESPDAVALQWIPSSLLGQTATCDALPADYPGYQWNTLAIALSGDGKRLALAGAGRFVVIDTTTMSVLQEFPAARIVKLQFLDQDRKLFLAEGVFGEYWEWAPDPSDMRYAVLDLASRQLLRFERTATTTLTTTDFQSTFSEQTGELLALVLDRTGEADKAAVTLRQVNLKQCGPDTAQPLALPQGRWVQMAADPLGRWYALLHEEDDTAGTSALSVFERHSGKPAKTWRLQQEIRSLTATPDGRQLLATTRAQLPAEPTPDYRRVGGGELRAFDIPASLLEAAKVETLAWSRETCRIEDETAQARSIDRHASPAVRRFTTALTRLPDERFRQFPSEENPDPARCSEETQQETWGVTASGELWIDRFNQMEHVDLSSGKVLDTKPLPRTRQRCASLVFDPFAVLAFEGDTVALRAVEGERRVVAARPGWSATRLEVGHGRAFVHWKSRTVDATTSQAGYVGTLHAIDRGTQIMEFTDFEGEEFSTPNHLAPTGHPLPPPAAGAYLWTQSYFNSVRVQRSDTSTATTTVLWDHLFPRPLATPVNGDPASTLVRVVSLGGSLGAAIYSDHVDVYDAAARRLVATLPVAGVQRAVFAAQPPTLLLEYAAESGTTLAAYALPAAVVVDPVP